MKRENSRQAKQIPTTNEQPQWQRLEAQTAPTATAMFSPHPGRGAATLVSDPDAYVAMLRGNAGRLIYYASHVIATQESPLYGATLLREAALMLDMMKQRQHTLDEANEARRAQRRKAARS